MNAFEPLDPAKPVSETRTFAHVDVWVFDLDNTLYPHTSRIWPQIDERITLYIADMFGLDGMSAKALQKYFYYKYGTTLRALIDEHGIDPHHFLDFAHDIDHTSLEANLNLGTAIGSLPGRKLILTNGSRKHAENVAKKLGILDHFEDVFDIAAADFVPKPERRAYESFLDKHAVDPARAAMFEDLAKNLIVPRELGMMTTLVVPKTVDPFREAFEQDAVPEPYIDFITDDLTVFLKGCAKPKP
ncbi:pyrimidine 5'-nucleotidase [Microvirga flavescens]|uniref:pyrimidine 5'-nucleotidase n=1 Tax=Microvirga flavescens TaxID=2249811 RepID=UPI000DD94E6B|nr:pyrimidine 5'-nucleotidase [Microvirga flavescens]